MEQDLTLKNILLRKLSNTLNPNYVNKIISLMICLGFGMMSKNIILELLLSLELITEIFSLKVQLSDTSNNLIFYAGFILLLVSLTFFYLVHVSRNVEITKSYPSLKSVAVDIRKLLEENNRIFRGCGPNSSAHHRGELRQEFSVWSQAKAEIIGPNNDKIYSILNSTKNIKKEELPAVRRMKSHIEHFKVHLDNENVDYSNHQFPQEFSDLIYKFSKPSKAQSLILERISTWIETNINMDYIESVSLYGSCLYTEDFHDIDILAKTKDQTVDEVRSHALEWKELERKFRTEFSFNLHPTVFSELEAKAYEEFTEKLGETRKVI